MTHPAPSPENLVGQTIGNYRVVRCIGQGGMGTVYLGEHPQIGKRVAIKVLHPEYSSNADLVNRFFNEARSVNDIQHPNIVDIVDFGETHSAGGERLVYFIMEYLPGKTLAAVMAEEGPLGVERAVAIVRQVARALAASHRAGIIHRDLKPDNVMLTTREHDEQVKLLDFGIAKLTQDSDTSARTRSGVVMGTPRYMSPEQCEGNRQLDHRSDIYSLGVVLYEVLAGRPPFDGASNREIMTHHLMQPATPPSNFREIVPALEATVLRALEKDPERRFASMDQFAAALAGTGAHPTSTQTAVPAPASRRGLALAALGVLAAAGLTVYAVGRDRSPVEPPAPATAPAFVTTPLPRPVDAPTAITLSVETSPPGASVSLDGRRLGLSPISVKLPRQEPPAALTVELAGYEAAVEAIALTANLAKKFELKKKSTTPRSKPRKLGDDDLLDPNDL
jgi:serine/threonine-protein kinase